MDNSQSGISYRPIWSDEDTFEELDEELAESIRRFNAEDDAVLKKQIEDKDKEIIDLTIKLMSILKTDGKTLEEVSRISNIPLETVKEYWD